MTEKKTRTLNVPKIPQDLFKALKELAEPYGSWLAWLRNIQDDFRRAREEVNLEKRKAEFCEREIEELKKRLRDTENSLRYAMRFAPKKSSNIQKEGETYEFKLDPKA